MTDGVNLLTYFLKLIGTKVAEVSKFGAYSKSPYQRMSPLPEHSVILQDEVDDAPPDPADLAAVGEVA